jgi:hypothetical protein
MAKKLCSLVVAHYVRKLAVSKRLSSHGSANENHINLERSRRAITVIFEVLNHRCLPLWPVSPIRTCAV